MKHSVIIIQTCNTGRIHLGYAEKNYTVTMCGDLFDKHDATNTFGSSDTFGSITCPFCLSVYQSVFTDDEPKYFRSTISLRLDQINKLPRFNTEPILRYGEAISRAPDVSAKYLRKSMARGR